MFRINLVPLDVFRSFFIQDISVTTRGIKLFTSIRKGNFFSSFGGKRSKTISFVTNSHVRETGTTKH